MLSPIAAKDGFQQVPAREALVKRLVLLQHHWLSQSPLGEDGGTATRSGKSLDVEFWVSIESQLAFLRKCPNIQWAFLGSQGTNTSLDG